jgi:Flp pilus assembly pilin Flp
MKLAWMVLLCEENGQDLVEYCLLAAVFAIGTLLAVQSVRDALINHFSAVETALGS